MSIVLKLVYVGMPVVNFQTRIANSLILTSGTMATSILIQEYFNRFFGRFDFPIVELLNTYLDIGSTNYK